MNHEVPGLTGTVEVLLSTFNGERYLAEQLESLWAQDYKDLTLSVRDDGSSDSTPELLGELGAGHDSARFVEGPHLGAGKSFLELLRHVSPNAEYAAFCDQDDVWLPGKLSTAVAALDCVDGPALYCSAVQLVREDLTPVRVHRRCVRGPSFENALVENVATGCTIVLNRPAIDLLASRSPEHFVMHDAWCYLVVSGCGRVIYDPTPWALYRLHGSNTMGVGETPMAEWLGRARRMLAKNSGPSFRRQAEELEKLYAGKLSPRATQTLELFLTSLSSFSRRAWYAIKGAVHRQHWPDDLLFRIMYVSGRF